MSAPPPPWCSEGIPWSIVFIALIHLLMEVAEVDAEERDIWQRDSWQRPIASLQGLKTRRGLGASYPRHAREEFHPR